MNHVVLSAETSIVKHNSDNTYCFFSVVHAGLREANVAREAGQIMANPGTISLETFTVLIRHVLAVALQTKK